MQGLGSGGGGVHTSHPLLCVGWAIDAKTFTPWCAIGIGCLLALVWVRNCRGACRQLWGGWGNSDVGPAWLGQHGWPDHRLDGRGCCFRNLEVLHELVFGPVPLQLQHYYVCLWAKVPVGCMCLVFFRMCVAKDHKALAVKCVCLIVAHRTVGFSTLSSATHGNIKIAKPLGPHLGACTHHVCGGFQSPWDNTTQKKWANGHSKHMFNSSSLVGAIAPCGA